MAHPTVDLFSKPSCSYCARAEDILDEASLVVRDRVADDASTAAASLYFSGSSLVPQIFLGRYHIEGAEDLEALWDSRRLRDLAARLDDERLPVDETDSREFAEGAEEVVLREHIPRIEGARDDDKEAWPILRFYKQFFGFWPNCFAYLRRWPEAYKLFTMAHNMSVLRGPYGPALGMELVPKLAYAASDAHGCDHCRIHSAATMGSQSMQAVAELEETRADGVRDDTEAAFELALTELAEKATLNEVSDRFLERLYRLGRDCGLDDGEIDLRVDGVAMISASFGFLNVFNDMVGVEIEGDWYNRTREELGFEADRHDVGAESNPSNLDYDLPEEGPTFADVIERWESKVGDVESFARESFGLMPNWLEAWPEQFRARCANMYAELMGDGEHSSLDPELKHLMARVSSIAKGHQYLSNLEGYLAFRAARRSGRDVESALDRVRACYAVATDQPVLTAARDRFDDREVAALRVAKLSANVPISTPTRHVQPAMEAFGPDELVEVLSIASLASLVQRFVAIVRPELDDTVEGFCEEHDLETDVLHQRYPLPEESR